VIRKRPLLSTKGLNWCCERDVYDSSRVVWTLGPYYVGSYEYRNTCYPWVVAHRGVKLTCLHGLFSGYRRFKTAEAAMRWVDKELGRKPKAKR
jgi:hypothetical protein